MGKIVQKVKIVRRNKKKAKPKKERKDNGSK